MLVAHVAGYLAALVLVLSPAQAVAFVLVQQGLFGLYLGCSFAPNHKGMPTLTDADQLDFLRRQVLTSRNVAGSGPWTSLLGGLNYQIEHHLFPSMPRPNLRQAQPLVRAFCPQHGLPYCRGQPVRLLRPGHPPPPRRRRPATPGSGGRVARAGAALPGLR